MANHSLGVKTALVTIRVKWDGSLNGTTNLDGIVVFDLPDKPCSNRTTFAPDYVGNCSEVEFVTARLLNAGVVGKNWCHTSAAKGFLRSKTWEIVIFATRISPWRALLRELF